MKEVVIIAATRTPIGSFGGSLSSFSAPHLGAAAIKSAVEKAGISPDMVQEVYMGNVLSAGMGQAPATQATRFAGLPDIPATAINKVCASGMKAVMLAAQSIALGQADVIVAGGMESMSNVPFYLNKARTGYKLGNAELTDGLIKDGLWDVYNDYHMGSAGELCATTSEISREAQDNYAVQSYQRAIKARQEGWLSKEISAVEVADKKGNVTSLDIDEEVDQVKFDKIPGLKPVFHKEGTITAANASSLNDGAAALVLMSREKADELNIKPLARIIAYADAQEPPEKFTTAPAKAIPIAIKRAGLSPEQIDYYEINEAFSVVALANNKALGLQADKVNVNGGAVALGHPLGASGARIRVTFMNVLRQNGGRYGVAGICNGGGGASAMVLENLSA